MNTARWTTAFTKHRIRMTMWLSLGAALAFILMASGCTNSFSGNDQPDARHTAAARAAGVEPRGVLLSDPRTAPDFELVDHTGEQIQRSSLNGQIVAVFFGYTGCPDVCPLTLSFMSYATRHLDDQRGDVAFLFVTVDPQRDTPDRLAAYLERVDAPVTGLTGSIDDLASVWKDYDIAVERHDRSDGNYLVDHSAQIWLIDRSGTLRMFIPMGADGDDLAHDLRWLLEEEV